MVIDPPATAERVLISRRDGGALVVERFGPSDGPPLLLTHGFGQTRLAWEESAHKLAARGFQVLTLDARGHGDSDWSANAEYTLDDFLDDLDRVVATLDQPPILIGASMGGLLGLLAMGERDPPPFAALVLVDIAPRWETAGVERILDFMRARPDGFASIDEALELVQQYLPHRAQRHDAGSLGRYLRPRADGRLRWHWDPRLLESVGAAATPYLARLISAAQNVRAPTLLVSGAMSDVIRPESIAEFLTLVPHAEHVEIADATHMLVGDRNARFLSAVEAFLQRLGYAHD
jgi:pimeloyl-ACP methyl ester carboxylesterase